MANERLREMGPGEARSLCQLNLRDDPQAKAAYDDWCNKHEAQLRSMGEDYRAVGSGGRIAAKGRSYS